MSKEDILFESEVDYFLKEGYIRNFEKFLKEFVEYSKNKKVLEKDLDLSKILLKYSEKYPGEYPKYVYKIIETAIECGLDSDRINRYKLLHILAEKISFFSQEQEDYFLKTVNLLLEAGADPNERDEEYRTPLHILAKKGSIALKDTLIYEGREFVIKLSIKFAKILIDYGINLEALDGNMKTAIDYIEKENQLKAVLAEAMLKMHRKKSLEERIEILERRVKKLEQIIEFLKKNPPKKIYYIDERIF